MLAAGATDLSHHTRLATERSTQPPPSRPSSPHPSNMLFMLCFPFAIVTAAGGVKIFADKKLWNSLQNVWGIYLQAAGPWWKVLKHSGRPWRPWHRPTGDSLRIPDGLGSEPGRTRPFLNQRCSLTAALTRGTLSEGKRQAPWDAEAGSVWRHLGVTSAWVSPGLTLITPGCQSAEHKKVKNNLQIKVHKKIQSLKCLSSAF